MDPKWDLKFGDTCKRALNEMVAPKKIWLPQSLLSRTHETLNNKRRTTLAAKNLFENDP